jgi:hypothetical protein
VDWSIGGWPFLPLMQPITAPRPPPARLRAVPAHA